MADVELSSIEETTLLMIIEKNGINPELFWGDLKVRFKNGELVMVKIEIENRINVDRD